MMKPPLISAEISVDHLEAWDFIEVPRLYVLVKLNRRISMSQLKRLLALHLTPIKQLVLLLPERALILRWASDLDAFSCYPLRA